MASPSTRRDLKALYRLISQADLVPGTIPDPGPFISFVRESLASARALAKDLVNRATDEALAVNPAAALGSKGGTKTAERGPEYFTKISAMRTNRKGGRPRKQNNQETFFTNHACLLSGITLDRHGVPVMIMGTCSLSQ
jgi:hypothetical protein